MDVRLPNGTTIANVPEGTNKWQIAEKAISRGLAKPEDFGQESASPSVGGRQDFLAGAGKSVMDIGRGLKQIGAEAGNMMGLVSDETVAGIRSRQDEVNAQDAPLMQGAAGISGNIAGTLATTLLPAGMASKATTALPRTHAAMRAFINPQTIRAAATAGGIQGALQPVGTDQSRTLNTAVGAGLGAALPVAGKALRGVAQPVTNALKRGGQSAVQTLERAGVPLDAAQRTGSQFLQRIRSGFSDNPLTAGRAREFADRQLAKFTGAILKTIGANGDEATRPVIDDAAQKIGSVFQNIAKKTAMQLDGQLDQDLLSVIDEATNGLEKDALELFGKQVDALGDAIDPITGAINGQKFNALRSRLGRLSVRPDIGEYARAMDESLLNMLERQAPAEAAALQTARAQWRNLQAIMPSIAKTSDKYIRPSILINQLTTKANQNLSRRGLGGEASRQLLELAEAGASVLPDFNPNSGTTARGIAALAIPGAIGAGVGYAQEGDLSGALAYGVGGAAAPMLLQRAIQNQGTVGNYLSRGIANPAARNALLYRPPGVLTSQLPAVAGNALARK